MLPGGGDHARVHAAPDRACGVHLEHLRRDDGDLVRVREEILDASLGAAHVPEGFVVLRGR